MNEHPLGTDEDARADDNANHEAHSTQQAYAPLERCSIRRHFTELRQCDDGRRCPRERMLRR